MGVSLPFGLARLFGFGAVVALAFNRLSEKVGSHTMVLTGGGTVPVGQKDATAEIDRHGHGHKAPKRGIFGSQPLRRSLGCMQNTNRNLSFALQTWYAERKAPGQGGVMDDYSNRLSDLANAAGLTN